MNNSDNQRPSLLYTSITLSVIASHVAIFYLLFQLTIPEKKPINQALINAPRIEFELVNSSNLSTDKNNSHLQAPTSATNAKNKHDNHLHTTPQLFPELLPQNNTPTIASIDIDTPSIDVDNYHVDGYRQHTIPSELSTKQPSTYSFNGLTYSVEDTNNLSSDDSQQSIFDHNDYNDSTYESSTPIKPRNSIQTSPDSLQDAQNEADLNADIITLNTIRSPNNIPVEETKVPNPEAKPFKPKNITPLDKSFATESNYDNTSTMTSIHTNKPQQSLANNQDIANTQSSDKHTNQATNKYNDAHQNLDNIADNNQSRMSNSQSITQDITSSLGQTQSIIDHKPSKLGSSVPSETQHTSGNDFGHLIIAQQNYQTFTNPADVKKPIVLTSDPIYVSAEESLKNLIEPITAVLPMQLTHSPTRKWKVVVVLYVDKQGNIMQQPEPIVKPSSGNIFIDEDALSLAKQARFRPFIRNGQPQIAEIRLPLTYQR